MMSLFFLFCNQFAHLDFSDRIVLRNVLAHVQAAIISMAVVIWDVLQAGRGIIVIKAMTYQVLIKLEYWFIYNVCICTCAKKCNAMLNF